MASSDVLSSTLTLRAEGAATTVLPPPRNYGVRRATHIVYILSICCRHHAHDGQGDSNNRSKATLQGMALPSRFLFCSSVKPATDELQFRAHCFPHRFAIPFSGGYCIRSYQKLTKEQKTFIYGGRLAYVFLGKKKSPAAMQGFSNEVIREEENNLV